MRVRYILALSTVLGANAHGDHGSGSQKPMVPDDANWMTKHMAGEDFPFVLATDL